MIDENSASTPDKLVGMVSEAPVAQKKRGRPIGSKKLQIDGVPRREESIRPPVMAVAEAARYLRVSVQSIHKEVAAGRLPHIRIGKRVLIIRDLLDEVLFKEARVRWNSTIPEGEATKCTHCGKPVSH